MSDVMFKYSKLAFSFMNTIEISAHYCSNLGNNLIVVSGVSEKTIT